MGPASVPRCSPSPSHAHTPTCSRQRRPYSQAVPPARPHLHGTRGRKGHCTDPRRPDGTPRSRQPGQESPRLPRGGGGERRQVDKKGTLVHGPQRRKRWSRLRRRCAQHNSARLVRRKESRLWIHGQNCKKTQCRDAEPPHGQSQSPPLGDAARQCSRLPSQPPPR